MAFLSGINNTVSLTIAGAALVAAVAAGGLLWWEKRAIAALTAENAELAQSLSNEKERNRVFTEYIEGRSFVSANNVDCVLQQLAITGGSPENCGPLPDDAGRPPKPR